MIHTYVPPGSRTALRKHPDESVAFYADFVNLLTGEAALTGTPTLTEDAGITVASPTISGTRVVFQASGGTAQTDYTVEVKCADDDGNTHVIEVPIEVRDN